MILSQYFFRIPPLSVETLQASGFRFVHQTALWSRADEAKLLNHLKNVREGNLKDADMHTRDKYYWVAHHVFENTKTTEEVWYLYQMHYQLTTFKVKTKILSMISTKGKCPRKSDRKESRPKKSSRKRTRQRSRRIYQEETPTEYVIEKIIKHRGDDDTREYLVRWEGYESEDDTWEPSTHFSGTVLADYHKSF